MPENDKLNVVKEKQIDLIGSESTETVRLLSYPKKENVTLVRKIEVINGNSRIYSQTFTDGDTLDFEDFHVEQFGANRLLIVSGLDVGAHGSSIRLYSSDESADNLIPVCSGYNGDYCIFSSNRMSEPLIEDLNDDGVPEIVELNENLNGKVVARIYRFYPKRLDSDVVGAGAPYSLGILDQNSSEYYELMKRYPSLN
jgi:hypothetical protein